MARVAAYAQSLTRQTNATGTPSTAVSLSFTPTANKSYIVIFSCEMDIAASSDDAGLYTTDGTTVREYRHKYDANEITEGRRGFMMARDIPASGSPVAATWALQWDNFSNGTVAVGIQNARITILELGANDLLYTTNMGSSADNATTTMATLGSAQAFPSTGQYLVLAFAANHVSAGSTSSKSALQVLAGGTTYAAFNPHRTRQAVTGASTPWATGFLHTASAGHTVALQHAATAASHTSRTNNVVICAIRTADLPFFRSVEARAETTTTSQTDVAKATLGPETLTAGDYVILDFGYTSGTNSGTQRRWQLNHLDLNGTNDTLEAIDLWTSANPGLGGYSTVGSARKITETAGSKTYRHEHRVSATGMTGKLREVGIYLIGLDDAAIITGAGGNIGSTATLNRTGQKKGLSGTPSAVFSSYLLVGAGRKVGRGSGTRTGSATLAGTAGRKVALHAAGSGNMGPNLTPSANMETTGSDFIAISGGGTPMPSFSAAGAHSGSMGLLMPSDASGFTVLTSRPHGVQAGDKFLVRVWYKSATGSPLAGGLYIRLHHPIHIMFAGRVDENYASWWSINPTIDFTDLIPGHSPFPADWTLFESVGTVPALTKNIAGLEVYNYQSGGNAYMDDIEIRRVTSSTGPWVDGLFLQRAALTGYMFKTGVAAPTMTITPSMNAAGTKSVKSSRSHINLMPNGDAEDDLTGSEAPGWFLIENNYPNDPLVTVSDAHPHVGGTKSFRFPEVEYRGVGGGKIPVTPGSAYQYRVKVMSPGGNPSGLFLRVAARLWSFGEVSVPYVTAITRTHFWDFIGDGPMPSAWTNYSFEFTPGDYYWVTPSIYRWAPPINELYFDDFEFVQTLGMGDIGGPAFMTATAQKVAVATPVKFNLLQNGNAEDDAIGSQPPEIRVLEGPGQVTNPPALGATVSSAEAKAGATRSFKMVSQQNTQVGWRKIKHYAGERIRWKFSAKGVGHVPGALTFHAGFQVHSVNPVREWATSDGRDGLVLLPTGIEPPTVWTDYEHEYTWPADGWSSFGIFDYEFPQQGELYFDDVEVWLSLGAGRIVQSVGMSAVGQKRVFFDAAAGTTSGNLSEQGQASPANLLMLNNHPSVVIAAGASYDGSDAYLLPANQPAYMQMRLFGLNQGDVIRVAFKSKADVANVNSRDVSIHTSPDQDVPTNVIFNGHTLPEYKLENNTSWGGTNWIDSEYFFTAGSADNMFGLLFYNYMSAANVLLDEIVLERVIGTAPYKPGLFAVRKVYRSSHTRVSFGTAAMPLTATLNRAGYKLGRGAAGTITDTAVMVGVGGNQVSGSGQMVLSATLAAAGRKSVSRAAGDIADSAVMNLVSRKVGLHGLGIISATPSLVAAGRKIGRGSGALSDTADFAYTTGGGKTGAAGNLAGSAGFAYTARKVGRAALAMSAPATLVGAGRKDALRALAASYSASLVGAGRKVAQAGPTLPAGPAGLFLSVSKIGRGSGAISASAAMGYTYQASRPANGTMNATAIFAYTATKRVSGVAAMADTADFAMIARKRATTIDGNQNIVLPAPTLILVSHKHARVALGFFAPYSMAGTGGAVGQGGGSITVPAPVMGATGQKRVAAAAPNLQVFKTMAGFGRRLAQSDGFLSSPPVPYGQVGEKWGRGAAQAGAEIIDFAAAAAARTHKISATPPALSMAALFFYSSITSGGFVNIGVIELFAKYVDMAELNGMYDPEVILKAVA
jgi:hypothetical protein